jgi:hypothetical protein
MISGKQKIGFDTIIVLPSANVELLVQKAHIFSECIQKKVDI